MFAWWKRRRKNTEEAILEEKKLPVILTIHGYGRRRKHEFDNLALWGKKDGYDIVQFDMYDLFDEGDHDWMQWVQRAKDQLDRYRKENRDIYLVGFSMGGVIASYLAAIVPVQKLILLAPAFNYINMDMITDAITKSAISLWSNDKKEEIQLPRSFYGAFSEVIKNLKKYIGKVTCPVLLLHGDHDEVISVKSSIYAYDKIPHEQKKLIILHEGHHRLLMDEAVNWEAYQLMKLFFEGVLLNDEPKEMAEDIMEKLVAHKHMLDAQKEARKQEELLENDTEKEGDLVQN